MNSMFRAAAALALTGATLPALAASATATRAFDFKPESNAGLTVRNLIGDIRVVRGDTPGIRITATATVETESQAEAERLVKLVDYRSSDVGAGSRFDVRIPDEDFPVLYSEDGSKHWFSTSRVEYLGERIRLVADRDDAPALRVDLLISAPAGAKVEVKHHFGDASAERFSGTLRLDGGAGRLTSTGGEGQLELDSGSGAVTVNGHRGSVAADTGSGSVKITDCECEIVADTGSGSVQVTNGRGRIAADTGSGDVRVEGFAGSLEADTGSGSVVARGVSEVTSLLMDTGSGGVDIDGDLSAMTRLGIDTGSGSVTLRSSAQPSMEIHIDTGSGGVDVDVPGASMRQVDDVTIVKMKDGAARGVIDTGSGSVRISFR
ncbi:MAG TPA: DUF4097 family beta strand repeat-containing protein [Steroidobacteraceae bacterium]|nr:DUF4097 family beta strand repeat-containing protein [Steroidobacteraceae bacterium]